MFQYLYEWTQNLAFYIVLITAVLHAVPDSGYKKYIVILFLTGVLLLVIALPERKTGQEDTAEFDAG